MQKLKKNGTRFLCLSMAIVMVFGSITGCGKKANKNNVTDFETVSESTEGITEKESEPVTEKPTEKPTEKETESTPEETTTEKETEIKKYTVTLYYGDKELGKVTEEEGTLLSELTVPVVEGMSFEGWYYDIDLTDAVEPKAKLSADVKLYGKYVKSRYTVTLYNGKDKLSEITLEKGNLLSEIIAPFNYAGT